MALILDLRAQIAFLDGAGAEELRGIEQDLAEYANTILDRAVDVQTGKIRIRAELLDVAAGRGDRPVLDAIEDVAAERDERDTLRERAGLHTGRKPEPELARSAYARPRALDITAARALTHLGAPGWGPLSDRPISILSVSRCVIDEIVMHTTLTTIGALQQFYEDERRRGRSMTEGLAYLTGLTEDVAQHVYDELELYVKRESDGAAAGDTALPSRDNTVPPMSAEPGGNITELPGDITEVARNIPPDIPSAAPAAGVEAALRITSTQELGLSRAIVRKLRKAGLNSALAIEIGRRSDTAWWGALNANERSRVEAAVDRIKADLDEHYARRARSRESETTDPAVAPEPTPVSASALTLWSICRPTRKGKPPHVIDNVYAANEAGAKKEILRLRPDLEGTAFSVVPRKEVERIEKAGPTVLERELEYDALRAEWALEERMPDGRDDEAEAPPEETPKVGRKRARTPKPRKTLEATA